MTQLGILTRGANSETFFGGERSSGQLVAGLLSVLAVTFVSLPAFADDEYIYLTGQVGSSSTSLSNVHNVGGSFEPGTTASAPDLDNSTLLGAKMGFFSRKGLLGTEVEFFQTHPDIKHQTQTFNEPTFGPYPQTRGGSHKVTVWALNVVARQPITKRLVAHVGVGPALIRSELQFDNEQAQSSSRTGLNTQLGLTYFISKYVMLSAEWKHNSTTFHYPTHGTTEGFDADYKANSLAIGVSYAFDWAWPWKGPNLRGKLGMEPTVIGPDE
jgi:opacity protein-like surface antigen